MVINFQSWTDPFIIITALPAAFGRAVIGGLLLATVATLFLVPLVFSILHRKGVPRRDFEPEFGSTGAGDPAR